MDSSALGRSYGAAALLFAISLCLAPFGLWKIVELVLAFSRWFAHHWVW